MTSFRITPGHMIETFLETHLASADKKPLRIEKNRKWRVWETTDQVPGGGTKTPPLQEGLPHEIWGRQKFAKDIHKQKPIISC